MFTPQPHGTMKQQRITGYQESIDMDKISAELDNSVDQINEFTAWIVKKILAMLGIRSIRV